MEIWLPKIVKDVNTFTKAWNKLLEWCQRNTLQSSSDILVTQSTHGTTLFLAKHQAPSAPSLPPSASVQNFMIVSVQGDWLTCRTWDGTTGATGSVDIYVAKQPELRHSVATQTVNGNTWTFEYYPSSVNPDGYRYAYSGSYYEYQQTMPTYKPNDAVGNILAVQPLGGTGLSWGGVDGSDSHTAVWQELTPRWWGQITQPLS